MTPDTKPPTLEFTLRVEPATPERPGRYTLTGQWPGRVMVFLSALELARYLEWIASGRPRLH